MTMKMPDLSPEEKEMFALLEETTDLGRKVNMRATILRDKLIVMDDDKLSDYDRTTVVNAAKALRESAIRLQEYATAIPQEKIDVGEHKSSQINDPLSKYPTVQLQTSLSIFLLSLFDIGVALSGVMHSTDDAHFNSNVKPFKRASEIVKQVCSTLDSVESLLSEVEEAIDRLAS